MTLTLSVMLTMSLAADAALKIYKLKGQVTKKTASGSKSVQRRELINKSDVICIPSNGSLDILDTDSRRIYNSVATGTMTVDQLIKRAADDANSLTRKTNTTILSSVADNAKVKRSGYGAVGMSYHETDGVSSGLVVLPDGVSMLSYLMNLSEDEMYDDNADVVLMRRDYADGEDSFIFSVFNTLNMPLYINVIDQKPENGKMSFYFDENPVVSPRGETEILQYRFIRPEETTGYIVIASPENFTLEDAIHLFDSSFSPSQDFFFSLLRK